jgi:hypothetical protein
MVVGKFAESQKLQNDRTIKFKVTTGSDIT